VAEQVKTWTPSTWRSRPIKQVPDYPDASALASVEARLKTYPPLVFAGEARNLTAGLGQVAEGKASLLQGIPTTSATPSASSFRWPWS
jgi:3-deoxy-7-phosphoheptulonate synthase